MSRIVDEVIAANDQYVRNFGDKGQLALPPARRFAILTCMDARLLPGAFAGLSEGDAHVIRRLIAFEAATRIGKAPEQVASAGSAGAARSST